jgi:hypothetical protein
MRVSRKEVFAMKARVKPTDRRKALTITGISLPVFVLVALLVPVVPASARPVASFPSSIPLPDGFRPEGIAVGQGTEFFVGSIPSGAIYRGDLRTGEGETLVPPQEARVAIGLSIDTRTNYLFVAGGPTGSAYVYDASTGETVDVFPLADESLVNDGETFVNDVIVTRNAAYFTDSFRPYLYRLPLSEGGGLPDPSAVEEIALEGDFDFMPRAFNSNGIDATRNEEWLVIVHSTLGTLYRVEPTTGYATLIDLGDEDVSRGDGILLDGRTLYVVQNRLNRIAVVELNRELTTGEITGYITDPLFDVPTTIAEFGRNLYAVNARFDVPEPGTASYDVIAVSKR